MNLKVVGYVGVAPYFERERERQRETERVRNTERERENF